MQRPTSQESPSHHPRATERGVPAPDHEPAHLAHRRRGRGARRLAALLTAVAALGLAACAEEQESTADGTTPEGELAPVTVYTGRHYGIEPVFAEFTEATGITVNFVTGKDPELRERLAGEGANTPADVLMTADAGNLALAADAGLLAPVDSDVLREAVPEELRDAEDRWFALSRRARTIFHSTERVQPADVGSYEALADPRWNGRLCLRPSSHPYTQSLVAAMIERLGAARTEEVVRGWVANEPALIDSDTEILEAIAAGQCDVAIANSYYLGRIQAEQPDFPVAIAWPNEGLGGNGVHVNISGAAVTAEAPNPTGARRLVEWLATDGQRAFADANFEYPANASVPPMDAIASWGDFTADPIAVSVFGARQPEAVALLERVGYA